MIEVIRADKHRDDAERVGRFKIMGEIFEHGRAAIASAAKIHEAAESLRLGLRHITPRRNVENAVELIQHTKLFGYALRMPCRPIRKDELASLKPHYRVGKLGRRLDRA